MSALKLTFPTPLPKNEKDLICMLLAGRLKDLFKGKLICAQLALDDLLKDVSGVSALGELQSALNGLRGSLENFKSISGYDNILKGVNQALGQVNNVFSLGGLCPSPVRAPKIPDLLPQLNANLFGQANNILSALGKLSNPRMCLGGGPGGFGINWSSMPGDLRNLKNAIKQSKDSNLGMTPALRAFTDNIKSQTSRMKGEIKRLEKNLSDPLGLNDKLNTGKNIQRVKNISDDYPVKDANGILHTNTIKVMIPADIESVIDNGDKTPIRYVTRPVLDYCGDVVGYEKIAITGDPAYIGWDPNSSPELNTDNPTVNPVADYSNYTYFFKQLGSVVTVYDTSGTAVTDLKLTRGIAYRLGFDLSTAKIKFYADAGYTTIWTAGLTYSRSPEYGNDMEIILPDNDTAFVKGELDWAVLIENPTTLNKIYWKTTDGVHSGIFTIDGVTEIPLADRTYDISMAVKKACLHLINVAPTVTIPVNHNTTITTRQYTASNRVFNGTSWSTPVTTTLKYDIQYQIFDDIETVDDNGNTDPNNKIIKSVADYGNSLYFITKRYVSVENGLEFNQIYFYISTSTDEDDATYCILIKLDNPLTILNSTKLPYTDNYSYKLTYLKKENNEFIPLITPISGVEETKFELIQSNGKQYIRWNLTSNTDPATSPKNEFIFQTDIEIDSTDTRRTFIESNPKEAKTYFYFKYENGTAVESTITLN